MFWVLLSFVYEPILSWLSCRYLVWVRKNNRQISIIREDFNHKEDEVRSDPDYEDIVESDIEAMSLFRKVGNLGSYTAEDDTTVGNRSALSRASSRASSVFRSRRQSLGGSVSSVPSKGSLPSVPEEKDGEDEDDDEEDMDSRKPSGNIKLGSPGASSLGSSSRLFSPESKVELSPSGSADRPNSEHTDSE